ncbi:MAG: hypothetical protein AABZ62_08350 [Planctomycetota bacterium]
MSQGLQALIAAVGLTVAVGIFFGIQILFRRFMIGDRIKDPRAQGALMEESKQQHHKKIKLKKRVG